MPDLRIFLVDGSSSLVESLLNNEHLAQYRNQESGITIGKNFPMDFEMLTPDP
jgi:hypothetical protein